MSKIILGIDPGTEISGWALIRWEKNRVELIDLGVIQMKSKASMAERLGNLLEELNQLIAKFQPDEVVVETQYVGINPKSALTVAMSRGVVLASAYSKKIAVYEVSPTVEKKGLTGKGNATKEEVQKMCSLIFGRTFTIPFDATDALALAYSHSNTLKFRSV